MNKYNIYCDESCHLEHDRIPIMCIGYIRTPFEDIQGYNAIVKDIKRKHKNLSEIKWNKISTSRLEMYKELIDFFFESNLSFRCLVVKYKNDLDHAKYNMGSHDNYYYKMLYLLLKFNIIEENEYNVYLDIKDTRGRERLKKINEVFSNYYHNKSPFIRFQHIRSNDNLFIQIADLFIGAVAFKARNLVKDVNSSKAKIELVEYLESKTTFPIDIQTELLETKFNIFDHHPNQI